MLHTVDTGTLCLAGYELSAGIEALTQLRKLAEPLRGCRVLHLNATPFYINPAPPEAATKILKDTAVTP